MFPATRLLQVHNETNRIATDKFKLAVDANPTAAPKQHHHRPPHALHAPAAKFIFRVADFILLSNGRVNTFPQQRS
jgi:hypothetical protein